MLQAKLPAPAQILQCLRQVAEGLSALHHCGLVHCDVRSAHILLFTPADGDGNSVFTARLGGCGRVRQSAEHVGFHREGSVDWRCSNHASASPSAEPYMDPFYALTGLVSEASDVFSLGVVLLEVLLGRSAQPCVGEQITEIQTSDMLTQTRRLRPKHLWIQFHERLSRGSGDFDAAEAILQMLPLQEWGKESLHMASLLLARMLEVEVQAWQPSQSLAPFWVPPPSERHTLNFNLPQQPPSRPKIPEVAERLEMAAALQVTTLPDEQRERVCVICMDAPVDTKMRPCQHAALCRDCASICVGRREPCPICRGLVQGFDVGDFQSTFALIG